MALTKCRQCGHTVSTEALACPGCGARTRAGGGGFGSSLVAIAIVIAVGWYFFAPPGSFEKLLKTTSQDQGSISGPTPTSDADNSVQQKADYDNDNIDLGGGVTMQFVLIHPGSFQMGSENGQVDEEPVHKVTITKPFYLGRYLVTQEQWERVMGSNPSHFKDPKRPVEEVSWYDCQKFLTKLNEKAPGHNFRLPTEAEWEYAARAGSTTEDSFGYDASPLDECAWYTENAGWGTHPVGEKKPNTWDLFDMHGNVWEWCADWYCAPTATDNYRGYPPGDQTDPLGPSTGSGRVVRGGSWYQVAAEDMRSASRSNAAPESFNFDLGLRCACDAIESSQ